MPDAQHPWMASNAVALSDRLPFDCRAIIVDIENRITVVLSDEGDERVRQVFAVLGPETLVIDGWWWHQDRCELGDDGSVHRSRLDHAPVTGAELCTEVDAPSWSRHATPSGLLHIRSNGVSAHLRGWLNADLRLLDAKGGVRASTEGTERELTGRAVTLAPNDTASLPLGAYPFRDSNGRTRPLACGEQFLVAVWAGLAAPAVPVTIWPAKR